MSDQKTRERIDKLIRLAAPSSNTTIEERSSAALRAVEMIVEHGITFSDTHSSKKSESVIDGAWVRTVALDYCNCSACSKLISRGDVVWVRILSTSRGVEKQFRHAYGTCSVA